MKMDTVWQAKVADSAIKSDNYGIWMWRVQRSNGIGPPGVEINFRLGIGPWMVNGSTRVKADFDFSSFFFFFFFFLVQLSLSFLFHFSFLLTFRPERDRWAVSSDEDW